MGHLGVVAGEGHEAGVHLLLLLLHLPDPGVELQPPGLLQLLLLLLPVLAYGSQPPAQGQGILLTEGGGGGSGGPRTTSA